MPRGEGGAGTLWHVLAAIRRVVLALVFVALLATISLGGAGVVAMWSHPSGTAARAELTWVGDGTLGSKLDTAEADLGSIAADVDRLALLARGALAALSAEEQDALGAALGEGSTTSASITEASMLLKARLAGLAGDEPIDALVYSSDVLARRGAMLTAIGATEGLERSWVNLTAGSLMAVGLIDLLGRHDPMVATAAAQGREARYGDALLTLASALGVLNSTAKVRDSLVNSTDVSILDEWLARNRRYDSALVGLYSALRDAGGLVTDSVRAAYAEETAARAQLPPDTRALVLIVAEVGRGGLNQAVIAIEQARGRLNLALESLTSAGPVVPDDA